MDFFAENIMIVMFLPIWVCLIILSGMFLKIAGNNKITFSLTIIASIIGLIFSIGALNAITLPQPVVIEQSYELLSVGNFYICAGSVLNTNSCISLIVLMTAMLFIQIYTYASVQNKKLFNINFLCLNFLNFALSGLILAPNLIQFFVLQTSIGIVIYLLTILHNKKENDDLSVWFLIFNIISDTALLIGIVLFSYISLRYLDLSPVEFLSFNNMENFKDSLEVFLYPEVYSCIIIPFILYSVIKMSLFPFQQYLCSINKTVSPVLAITNSVYIVFGGIYLLIKIYPVIPSFDLNLLLKAGIISALLFSFILISQKDIRKVFSYIISVQTALTAILISIGAIPSAVLFSVVFIFSVILNALCVNEIIEISKETDIYNIKGIKQNDFPLSVYWIVSTLSLSGICFGGFTQKDAIIKTVKISGNNFLFAVIMIVYFFLAYALFRFYYDVFEGEKKFETQDKNRYKTFCYMALCFFVVLPGFMFNISDLKMFMLDIITSLISILAIYNAYALYKSNKNLLPPIINNIGAKELYIPQILDSVYKIINKLLNVFEIFEKNIIDNILKSVFIPFIRIFKGASQINNTFILKIWIILFIVAVVYASVYFYNYVGSIY